MRSEIEQNISCVGLMRRWVVDYFNRQDPAACAEFIEPEYSLSIGDVLFKGRDQSWLPAVDIQMQRFPGMGMTVHQLIAGNNWVAAWFSEHGACEGRQACWSGVGIYKSNGRRLISCVAQEDYYTRQRQLKSGVPDQADAPALAPWDTVEAERNEIAENLVVDWLKNSWPQQNIKVRCDDEDITHRPLQFLVRHSEFSTLVSAGDYVAFHVKQTGDYLGGLEDYSAPKPNLHLHCNGLLHVLNGQVSSGRVIRDRMGLRSQLKSI